MSFWFFYSTDNGLWVCDFLSQRRRVSQRFFSISLRLCDFARDFLINAQSLISYHLIEIFPDEHHREAARHISFFIIHYDGFSDIR